MGVYERCLLPANVAVFQMCPMSKPGDTRGSSSHIEKRHVPSKELCDNPIVGHEGSISEREKGAKVCTSPEEIRSHTSTSELCKGISVKHVRISSTLSSMSISNAQNRVLTFPFMNGRSAIALSEPIYARLPWCE
jgi:hypothetical protein